MHGAFAICLLLQSQSLVALEKPLLAQTQGLRPKVLRMALKAAQKAHEEGKGRRRVLSVIDYERPSTKKRLWVFDLQKKRLLFEELVAHGKNTGGNLPRGPSAFSNTPQSLKSSVGLFETRGTYSGKHGYSLKLEGLEPGFNNNAMRRAIVIHGADYVSKSFIRRVGRLGRSWGCPALDTKVSRQVIDAIKNRSLLFVYYPVPRWLQRSKYR